MHPVALLAEVSVLSMAFRLIVSLGIVLGLIALLAWAARRQKGLGLGFGGRGTITVRAREQLGRGTTIALVQVGGRTLLIGANEHAIEVLAEGDEMLPPEDVVTADDRTSSVADPDGSVSPGMNMIEMLREWSVRRT